jgi:hypothetical protein
MLDPKYQVNITWYPARTSGQQLVNIGGVTQSVSTYNDGYFIASMPELKIVASGSTYPTALSNLLVIATSSTTLNPGSEPWANTRTW